MAKYMVRFSGSIEVEDSSSKESAIAHVQNCNLAPYYLEFEAEEVEDVDSGLDEINLYKEHKGYKIAEDGTLVEVK
jgi:hypothetical protein|tara:strand:- start:891 stop:1118 length:228 start_codon:yes stop_codon:yes gene_type:complete